MNIQTPRDFIDRRQFVSALRGLRRGDFSVRLPEEADGADSEIARLFNEIVSLNDAMSQEFERLSRVVGKEGRITQRGRVKGATGGWESAVSCVNELIEDMVQPTAEVARVIGAVAKGDLSQSMAVEIDGRALRGEFLRIGKVVNTMVEQLASFASEVTRVAREVGTEGKLGGQAKVRGVAGTWKDLTDNVNAMATNLTSQVRNIAEVTTAVARGDLSKKITVEVKGEILELKDTINTMVDQLNGFASEVTRVAREVGTEGKLGGQAAVPGVAGTWKDLTDNVNLMAENLTGQVRNIAEVTTAVARGDLSKKITVDVKGEILELKDTINTMVDQLNGFASEVTRVAGEVGTEGKLGGQAKVKGVAGTWKDLTDNVNAMATNLTSQVRNIAEVTTAVARGDLSKKITVEVKGEILELKNTINTMVDQLNAFASEVTRVAREVGTEGELGGQAKVPGVAGTWADLTDNVNLMAANLTGQVRNIADVTTAVAKGDLSKKITVDVKGEMLELKNTINTMVDQLNSFASEVTRVAGEVGTEGKLGGQAHVRGVGGTWKDLTDNVNLMATNLTNQVRGIAQVVTAVAQGNLKRKLTFDAKGEIAALADTINFMIDTLSTFGDQVTNMAREVGIEGKLGGQARVPGAAGLWRDLTDNVNQLAANLTNQVRAIADVATAVTKGDLTRSIAVQASGEMAALKDTINEMISNLKEQTLKNAEQDWLKTNLAAFSRMLQGERDLATVSNLIMSELPPLVNSQYGVFYVSKREDDEIKLELAATYGVDNPDQLKQEFRLREGLIGQAAADRRPILLTKVPPDFLRICSGLGQAKPANVNILPVLFEGEVKAVIELASFSHFNETHQNFLDQLVELIGILLNTIAATMRTERLLKQSQLLTQELQSRQTELTTKQEELHAKNDQLVQAQKMDAIGKLTGGIAHDFNNLLAAVLGGLGLIERRAKLGDEHKRILTMTKRAADQGSDLVRRLLAFSRQQQLEPGALDLHALQKGADDLFSHTLGGMIELQWHIPADAWQPFADRSQLELALMNLVINARDAMPDGGTIEVLAENCSVGPDDPLPLDEGDYVVISVIDSGCGIPPEMLDQVLEPFFTTKEVGKGTGLGLSMVYGFAKQSSGTLRLSSTVGEGTRAELWLPRASKGALIVVPSSAEEEPEALHSLRILLIDDHAEVRETTAAILADLGHSTVEAASGTEAIEALEASEEPFDLLITDYAMPRQSGTDVVRLARERQPGLPAIIVTGYADKAQIGSRASKAGLLMKPFTLGGLSNAIRSALHKEAAEAATD